MALSLCISNRGLSPRVRGNRPGGHGISNPERSIPACAGEPGFEVFVCGGSQVYPRVCGGTAGGRPVAGVIAGLSPRVRGNPRWWNGSPAGRGSIPACAGEPVATGRAVGTIWVYPRVCGGTPTFPTDLMPGRGLSPRVRGNLGSDGKAPNRTGSIPACAGEPGSGWRWPSGGTVYPRVCGGTGVGGIMATENEGLSPRVRGNRTTRYGYDASSGSIPACAGEPRNPRWWHRRRWVYPRVCGGTHLPRFLDTDVQGLSPRVRGNRGKAASDYTAGGSIPACAGEPAGTIWAGERRGVYPRVCGGTADGQTAVRIANGLSPRVRGNQLLVVPLSNHPGSIPACAGEPEYLPFISPPGRVYPRVCGGTPAEPEYEVPAMGLSPRVRGNPRRPAGHDIPAGSIPACAGEPRRISTFPNPGKVYPRVCGGTARRRLGREWAAGLSPRVRGNQTVVSTLPDGTRSIPACAGEPALPRRPKSGPAVYPRVCGGTSGGRGPKAAQKGLSPRVRGNRHNSDPESE